MLPTLHKITGAGLILAGLVILPLPVPVGLIMIVTGMVLLAAYFTVFARLIKSVRKKWPAADRILVRHHHRFPPVIRKTIDNTTPATEKTARSAEQTDRQIKNFRHDSL